MTSPASDIAFTPAVKAVQTRLGSRGAYAKREAAGGFQTEITPDLVEFLSAVDTAYLATANAEGQPYAQHRGGPRGFIRVVGQRTLGFADFKGNRQYVTTGNLSENDKAFLSLMDYAHRRRVKIWGRARVSEDPRVIDALMPEGYRARPEQAILFDVEAWDVNARSTSAEDRCDDIARALESLQQRIARLEEENAALSRPPGARLTPGASDGSIGYKVTHSALLPTAI
jgi:predicted pyridoxine 5'-phosphate oxidase superfamily flavin-nucleotide-binding protein